MSTLRGSAELRRRLKAIKQVFKPVGREWADETAARAKRYVPVRTGKTQRSIRRKNASQKKATVQAVYTARMVMKGSKAHEIKPKKMRAMKFTPPGGQPVFAKKAKHPGHGGNDFAERAARESLQKHDMLSELIELWNRAA